MVRHGQTAASRENRFSGSSDPPLTEVGEAMAQAFARVYASMEWEAIYTSPMQRTRQTADALCRLTGLQAIVEDGLTEIDYGEWEDVRLFRERIAQPVAAATMFVVTNRTAQLTLLGDRSHLSEELRNQEGT